MKKILCIVLLFMFLSSTCYAQTADDAAQDLAQYGIMNGFPDGTFRLEENVTRAQTVKMIMTVKAALGSAGYTGPGNLFSDVSKQHWAKEYIEGAFVEGVIQGFPDGTFRPEDSVTKYQAIKMVVCMLGYDMLLYYGSPEYPNDYLNAANDFNLVDMDELGNEDTIASRGFIAKLISAALDRPIAEPVFGAFYMELMNGLNGVPLKTPRIALEQESDWIE